MVRLVSAYRDKVQKPPGWRNWTKIIPSKSSTTIPTFSEFIEFILNGGALDPQDGDFDVHVKPFWHTCGMCNINYKFIAKTETLTEDSEYILREVNATDILPTQNRHINRSKGNQTSEELAMEWAKNLPENLLRKIINLYLFDFKAFGYDPEKYFPH